MVASSLLVVSAYEINFDDELLTEFGNIDDTYTEVFFQSWWNEFGGVVFRVDLEDLNDDVNIEIELDWSTDDIDCARQIRALYYNPQRWNRLRPLDQESLDILESIDSSYSGLDLDGGRYNDCSSQNDEAIFGQISHTRENVTYELVAWVEPDGEEYEQVFEENLFYDYNEDIAYGILFDSRWSRWISNYTWIIDENPDSFWFPVIKWADLWEVYESETIEIDGMSNGVTTVATVAELSEWTLFINDDYVGKTGSVSNGDEIYIELMSSDEYDSVTSARLTIGNKTSTFYLMTKDNAYDGSSDYGLSVSQKLKAFSIFKMLTETYKDNPAKMEAFLYTFQSMLEDRIDNLDNDQDEEEAVLRYLLDIIEWYLLDEVDYGYDDLWIEGLIGGLVDDNIHIAPNCKQYSIDYDTDRDAYYSPELVVMHYFISRDALRKYISYNNPWKWECGWTTNDPSDRSKRVAPNGKQYQIRKTAQWYTSYDFLTIRFFDTLDAIRKHIDINNPAIKTRDHELDSDFESEIYTASNGKEYKIQRVIVDGNDEKYMSYMFVYPAYFDSLDEIQLFIDSKNPEK